MQNGMLWMVNLPMYEDPGLALKTTSIINQFCCLHSAVQVYVMDFRSAQSQRLFWQNLSTISSFYICVLAPEPHTRTTYSRILLT